MSESQNRPYIPAIDQLRAMLALLIVFYHGWQHLSDRLIYDAKFNPDHWVKVTNPLLAVVVEGHTAVAGFMVLSGFIFVHGAFGRTVRYGEFIRNRFLRIYPLYLLLVVFAACLHPERDVLLSLARYVLPLANFGPQVFGQTPAMVWTVAVEFQFYLLFPFLLVLLERHGQGLFWRMIVLLVGLRLIMALLGEGVQALSYWTIAGRMDQFLIGMLAGRWYALNPAAVRRLGWQLAPAAIGLVALLYGFNQLGGWPAMTWWKALWPTVEALAWGWFILAYLPASQALPPNVGRAIAGIGRVSFSIYLLHDLVIEVVSTHRLALRVTGNPYVDAMATTAVLVVPITLCLAAFSFATIEAPFLGLRRRYLDDPPRPTS